MVERAEQAIRDLRAAPHQDLTDFVALVLLPERVDLKFDQSLIPV